ncbi:hypothetical protein HNR23_000703 [Nocardiopsis mwathae]|uniref:Uncharacterized protein n=1 Tax=Nocardiopsis mwathae TaxID=1472723 RepID=A0A7X0D3X0_9ACTN|nr:hypothetical protein [Nocardiopsis mwathae]MBB6170643.1 hypothetical protein [Nocardiopsis mwathae]
MTVPIPHPPSASDRGSSFIEFAGATLLIGTLCAFVLFSVGGAGGLGETIRNGINDSICRAFTGLGLGDCELSEQAAPPPQPPPICDVRTASRDRSLDGSFRNVRVEVAAGDQIVYQTDPVTGEPRAVYTTTGNSSVGVEASEKTEIGDLDRLLGQEKSSYEAFIQGGLGMHLNYEFEGADAHQQAEAMQELRRGNAFQDWAAVAMGTQGVAAEAGAGELARGIERGLTDFFGGDTDAVDRKYEQLLPDSVTVDLNMSAGAQGGLGLEGGGLGAEVSAGLEANASNQVKIDRDMNRTHTMSMSLDAELKLEGTADYSGALPASVSAAAEAAGGAGLTQRTQFDSDGNPVQAEIEIEYELGYSVGMSGEIELDLPEGVEIENPLSDDIELAGEHVRVRQTLSLDLTDDANREAYEQAFNTDTGFAAIPNPVAMADLDNARGLGERFAEDGTQTQTVYNVDKDDGDGYGASRGGFGGSLNTESTEESELLSMHHRDNRQPGARWEEVDCGV